MLPIKTASVDVTFTDRNPKVARHVLSFALDCIGGFLFGINAWYVRDALGEKAIRYQER